jgi:hypothetical protein
MLKINAKISTPSGLGWRIGVLFAKVLNFGDGGKVTMAPQG